MTQTTFTDNVLVDGSQDIKQLRVQGHTTQLQPIQTWEDSAGGTLAQLTGDGRLQVGDDVGLPSPDALIEAHRLETSTAKPARGFHSLGRVSGTLATLVQWIVGELELRGSTAIDALHTALRIRMTNLNTGTPTANAELRAADVEVINDATAGAAALPKATGLQVAVTNGSGKTITDAAALRLKVNNAGTITNPYAIFSEGPGITHLENFVEIKQSAAPATPATDFMRLYPKSDGKIYAKNWSGTEFDLTSSGGGVLPSIANARLTLSSATPVPIADVLAALQLYLTPYKGNKIALFDGTQWLLDSLSEISIKLTDTQNGTTTSASAIVTGLTDTSQLIAGMEVTGTGVPAGATISSINSATQVTLSANATANGTVVLTFKVPSHTLLDIFAFDNAGTPKLELVAWNAPSNGVVTSISNAAPRVATVPSHSLTTGQLVTIAGNSVAGNNATWRVGTTTATTFQLLNQDGTNSAAPGSVGTGGTWRRADQNTARATALVLQDGVYVKSGATTRRYLGTLRTTNLAGQSEDSEKKRLVYNEYNPATRKLKAVVTAGSSWTPSGSTWRAARNYFDYRVEVVVGNVGVLVELDVMMRALGAGAGITSGVGYDSITANVADVFPNLGTDGHISSHAQHYPNSIGYHFYQWLENNRSVAGATVYGISADGYQSGIVGDIAM